MKHNQSVTIVNCTINYLETQIDNLRLALEQNDRRRLKEVAEDIASESEKLNDQIDDHFIRTGN